MARHDSQSKGKKENPSPRVGKRQIRGAAITTSPTDAAIGPRERHQMIAEAAYYRAQQRGFAGGDPLRDWLEAEAEVSMRLGDVSSRASDGVRVGAGSDTVEFGVASGPKGL
jgi:hypothetical protein